MQYLSHGKVNSVNINSSVQNHSMLNLLKTIQKTNNATGS